MSAADALVDQVFERYMRPPERLTVSRHAEKYRVVAGKDSPYPGPWDNARSPWLIEPMDCWNEPGVTDIVIMASTQSGKTTVMENCLYFTIDQDPRPSLYISSDANAAKEFNDDRLIPNLEASPRFVRHVPVGDRRKLKRDKVTFPTMNLALIGAGSAGKLARISVQRGFFDEIDKWSQEVRGRGKTEGSAEVLAEARFDAVPEDEQKRIWVSTPTDEGVGIHKRYTESDQAHWETPCPHCGRYQWLRFRWERGAKGGVRWEGGLGEGLEGAEREAFCQVVRETAWYECEHCGGRIESRDKHWMNARGLYVRVGQSVEPIDPKGADAGGEPVKGVVVGEPPRTKVRGFHFNQLVVTWIGFGEVAAPFVKAHGVPDRGWVNRRLGEAWKQPGQHTDAARLAEMTRTAPGEEPYSRGTIPEGVSGLVGFVDIQSDHAWYVVRGYGEREQSWLIDYGRVECPEVVNDRTVTPEQLAQMTEDNWGYVTALMEKVYPDARDPETGWTVDAWGVDSGHRTGEVYRFVERFRDAEGRPRAECPVVHACKGDPSSGSGKSVWIGRLENDEMIQRHGLRMAPTLLHIHTDHYKDEVWARLHRVPPMYGCWRWPAATGAGGSGGGGMGGGVDEQYMRQMTAEHRVAKKLRGGIRHVWEMRPGRRDNHFLDCEVGCQAVAEVEGAKRIGVAPEPDHDTGGGLRFGRIG